MPVICTTGPVLHNFLADGLGLRNLHLAERLLPLWCERGRQLEERWGQLAGVAISGRPCFLMPGPYAPSGEVDRGLNLIRNLASAIAG